jgi:hypothetical protein
MPGVLGDLIDGPVGPRQVGETHVPEGVRRKSLKPGALGDGFDDLRPAPRADRSAAVAPRSTEKEPPVHAPKYAAALPQIGDQKLSGDSAEGDFAGPFAFRRFRAQVDQ